MMDNEHQYERRQGDEQNDAHADARPGIAARVLGAPLSIGNALVLLVIVGAIAVLVTLAIGPTREGSRSGINDADYARGLITLIFTGGTMLIAVLLALYVITADSPHASDRFTHGKEILSILIGVFGTILGFYFGKSDTPAPTQQPPPGERRPVSPTDFNLENIGTTPEITLIPTNAP